MKPFKTLRGVRWGGCSLKETGKKQTLTDKSVRPKGLENEGEVWDIPTVNAIVDNKRRVVLPKNAKPGLVFRITETATGYALKRLEEARPRKAWLVRKNGMSYLTNGHEITQADVEGAMDEIFD